MTRQSTESAAIGEAVFPPSDNVLEQFVRYLVVGGLAFVVDVGLLFLITELLGVHYLVSATVAFSAGLTTNYILSIFWVFSTRRIANANIEFAIFALVGVIGLGLNDLILWVVTDLGGLHYLLSKLFAAAAVLFWNFLARKLLLFS